MQVRLKVKDWFSVRLLPHQVLKVNKRWQLGASPVALRVNYECPLDNLGNPLASPAKLMVRWVDVRAAISLQSRCMSLELPPD